MKYYLGIDGGGTKTSYLVIDKNKKIIKEIVSLGTSIDTYPIKEVEKRILTNINKFNYKFAGVHAGLGGIRSSKDINDIVKIIKKSNKVVGKVNASNDVNNALRGSLNSKNGIVLISGTGAVAYGQNGKISHRVGGYGYKEGDIGSAYYLGYRAIQCLAKVIDKRCKANAFTNELAKEIKCFTHSDMCRYFNNAQRKDIANLAKIVTKYQNNPIAKKIILDAANEVILMIKTVYRECKFKSCKFSIIGSLGNADTLFKKTILNGLPKQIKFINKIYDANYGAAILASEL